MFGLETDTSVSWGNAGEFGGGSGGIAIATYSDGYGGTGDPSFGATSDAEAGYGVLKAKVTGTAVNATYLTQGATALAIFTDQITFGVVPPNGRAEFVITVTGNSTGLPAKVKLTVINHSKLGVSYSVDNITTPGDYRLIIPVDFNVLQEFEFLMEASLRISQGASETQTADFGQTATMTAIDLFDRDSNAISSYHVSSQSGTTYPVGAAVAVPAVSPLGAAALLSLLAFAGWRKVRG